MPDLTPQQERAVRDLLASAAHDEPVPAEVAARLDATLTGLVAERSPVTDAPSSTTSPGLSGTSPVTDELAVRRSRRRTRQRVAGALVAAAAAVVAVAVISQSVPSPISDSADSAAGGSEAGGGDVTVHDLEAPSSEGGGGSTSKRAPRNDTTSQNQDGVTAPYGGRAEARADQPAPTEAGLPVIRNATFLSDSRAAREQAGDVSDSNSRFSIPFPDCEADTGPGQQVLVRHRGDLALLVFREATGAVQQVDLYRCGTSEPLRTALIAAR